MILLIPLLVAAFLVVFLWPWLAPVLLRRDVRARLLDRLEEEWDREGDAIPRYDDRPWN